MSLTGQRGLTLVTTLILLAILGALFWILSFGEAYWDDLEVKGILHQAANLGYHDSNDEVVRNLVFHKLHEVFDEKVEDHGRIVMRMKLELNREDVQIERSQIPPRIDIWVTYSRPVNLFLIGKERTVTFNDHVSQDLSPVKW